jgi:hypothetical protein
MYLILKTHFLEKEKIRLYCGRAMALNGGRAIRWRAEFEPRSGHVGFVVDRVALGQVFSEFFGFSCQFLCHQLLHNRICLLFGAGKIGQ